MCDRIEYNETLARPEAGKDQSRRQSAEPFYSLIEQYHCPRCDGAINRDCVEGRIVPPTAGMLGTHRIVRVYCDHCGELFEASFVLVSGAWQIEDQPKLVTHKRSRQAFLDKLAALRGDVALAAQGAGA